MRFEELARAGVCMTSYQDHFLSAIMKLMSLVRESIPDLSPDMVTALKDIDDLLASSAGTNADLLLLNTFFSIYDGDYKKFCCYFFAAYLDSVVG